jgi:hypothetical protein
MGRYFNREKKGYSTTNPIWIAEQERKCNNGRKGPHPWFTMADPIVPLTLYVCICISEKQDGRLEPPNQPGHHQICGWSHKTNVSTRLKYLNNNLRLRGAKWCGRAEISDYATAYIQEYKLWGWCLQARTFTPMFQSEQGH